MRYCLCSSRLVDLCIRHSTRLGSSFICWTRFSSPNSLYSRLGQTYKSDGPTTGTMLKVTHPMLSLSGFICALFLYACFLDPCLIFVQSFSGLELPKTPRANLSSSSGLLISLPTFTVPLPTISQPSAHLSASCASISSSLGANINASGCAIATSTQSFSTSTTPLPTQSVDAVTLAEIELMQSRRLSNIIGRLTGASNISSW